MDDLIKQSDILSERLGLKYEPVGFMFADRKPDNALGFKKSGGGCIAPLIFNAAKGKTVAFDRDSTGYPCSAYYLGYAEWIFPGIEYFLSKGPFPGRECEFFVKTPEQARGYIQSLKSGTMSNSAIVFKPLNRFEKDEKPVAVILFANPDQMSALVFLTHFDDPYSRSRMETGFASACTSFFTIPLQYALKGEKKAFWGLHDIAVRSSFPADITSLSMPLYMYREICSNAGESFLHTENWNRLLKRIKEKA